MPGIELLTNVSTTFSELKMNEYIFSGHFQGCLHEVDVSKIGNFGLTILLLTLLQRIFLLN